MVLEYPDGGEEQLRGQHCNHKHDSAAGGAGSGIAASSSTSLGLSLRAKKRYKAFPCFFGGCNKVYRSANHLARHQLNRKCHVLFIMYEAIPIPIHSLLSHAPVRLMLLFKQILIILSFAISTDVHAHSHGRTYMKGIKNAMRQNRLLVI